MKQAITIERWIEAQKAERSLHEMTYENGVDHYRKVYDVYFEFLKIENDQQGRSIVEIGSGDFPALMFRKNAEAGIIEPMPSDTLKRICEEMEISLLVTAFEHCISFKADEIWLLNVMQHIIDPELFIEKCKETAEVIRFFEPINEGICLYHPHSYSQEDFNRWFGESELYTGGREYFHTATCAYGIWRKNK